MDIPAKRIRTLVTGGAGFIGSHLCLKLLTIGRSVLCLDNFFTGCRENILPLLSHPQFELYRHDVCIPMSLEVDEIYNLACPASPVHYRQDPVQTTKTCVLGAINVLALAQRLNAKVLQASTSEVYGDPLIHPQVESYWGNVNPIGTRSCYDEGKRCAETLFFDYHRQHNVRIKVARIFNTYGPGMQTDDGRVISNFIVQALRGQSITIYGSGDPTRSFCYVQDLVDGLISLMGTADQFTGPVNLGRPEEVTIRRLAEEISVHLGRPINLINQPLPNDDPIQRCPDISLARKSLNWEPHTTLSQGLDRTISYFQSMIGTQGRLQKGYA